MDRGALRFLPPTIRKGALTIRRLADPLHRIGAGGRNRPFAALGGSVGRGRKLWFPSRSRTGRRTAGWLE